MALAKNGFTSPDLGVRAFGVTEPLITGTWEGNFLGEAGAGGGGSISGDLGVMATSMDWERWR